MIADPTPSPRPNPGLTRPHRPPLPSVCHGYTTLREASLLPDRWGRSVSQILAAHHVAVGMPSIWTTKSTRSPAAGRESRTNRAHDHQEP